MNHATSTLLANPELQFLPTFADWLTQNWHVWMAFCREADKVWNRGRRKYSARTIVEVLRHESSLAEVGSEWKINNVRIPDMARLYMAAYPERDGLFETRVQPNTERGRRTIPNKGFTP